MRIEIEADGVTLQAQLNDTPTAEAIGTALPLQGRAHTWGNEIYFDVPVAIALAPTAVEEVPVGALAYWPTGSALCIFFGRTPASTSDMPRAYSAVNVFGQIIGDATRLKQVPDGAVIRITAAD